jgi:phosphohistidine phosphatase
MSSSKQILLLRHTKSSWGDPLAADFERPLNNRGQRAAQIMGKHMESLHLAPEIVVCSSARRTRETYERLGKVVKNLPVDFNEAIYEAPSDRLLDVLRAIDDRYGCVLMIGHNPGLESLTKILCAGKGDPQALARMTEKFSTGALAVLTSTVPCWEQLGPRSCRLDRLDRPGDLE